MKAAGIGYLAAAALWLVMFSPWTCDAVAFWPMMIGSTGALAAFGLWQSRRDWSELFGFRPLWLVVGVVAAGALYGIFVAGNAAGAALFGSAPEQVDRIYALRTGTNPLAVGLLLLLWIGPAEEIFWRGLIQHRLVRRAGPWRGCLAAAVLYAAVHVWAGNLILLGAALVCGLFWGWLAVKCKSIWPCIISHALWDVTIFILLPIGRPPLGAG